MTSHVAERFTQSFSHERASSNKGQYNSPGWARYQANQGKKFGKSPKEFEGRAVKRTPKPSQSNFKVGERIFHQKFGYGTIQTADGTKLTVDFEKAGEKKVLDGFVERP